MMFTLIGEEFIKKQGSQKNAGLNAEGSIPFPSEVPTSDLRPLSSG